MTALSLAVASHFLTANAHPFAHIERHTTQRSVKKISIGEFEDPATTYGGIAYPVLSTALKQIARS